MMDEQDLVAVPIISGWVDRIKRLLPEKFWGWMPIASILVGIGYAFLVKPGIGGASQKVALGFSLGMAASGLFAAGNSIMKAKESKAAIVPKT